MVILDSPFSHFGFSRQCGVPGGASSAPEPMELYWHERSAFQSVGLRAELKRFFIYRAHPPGFLDFFWKKKKKKQSLKNHIHNYNSLKHEMKQYIFFAPPLPPPKLEGIPKTPLVKIV